MADIIHNPAELLGIGRDPDVNRLMRACGIDEAHITGDASDYDRFHALACVLRDCAGHPLQARINEILSSALGCPIRLCMHTAASIWEAWAERFRYGEEESPENGKCLICGSCRRLHLVRVSPEDLLFLGDLLPDHPTELSVWTAELIARLPAEERPISWTIPYDYAYVRPDVYHVGLALAKAPAERSKQERDLLITQGARILSENNRQNSVVFLFGGAPGAFFDLIGYLRGNGYREVIVYVPPETEEPAEVEPYIGRDCCVRLGIAVGAFEWPEALRQRLAAYAAVAPIGRTVILSADPLPELAADLPT